VDDAIVVIENIVRFIEDGEKPSRHRSKARQIGFTVISISVSLIAVFIHCFSWRPDRTPAARVPGQLRSICRDVITVISLTCE